jgi:hypothetical protein
MPDILRPGGCARRARRENEPAMHGRYLAQLFEQRIEETVRGEIAGLRGGAQ